MICLSRGHIAIDHINPRLIVKYDVETFICYIHNRCDRLFQHDPCMRPLIVHIFYKQTMRERRLTATRKMHGFISCIIFVCLPKFKFIGQIV